MVCKCGYQNKSNARFCIKCGRKLEKKREKAGVIIAVAICMLAVIFLIFSQERNKKEDPGEQSNPGQTAGVEQSPTLSWEDNILMRDRALETIPLGSFKSSVSMNYVLGSSLRRAEISSVVFEDSVKNAPEDCWDASEAQDHSVLAWVIPDGNGRYELHIAGEGGVNGRIACEDLFCGYTNVTSIAFNNSFHTEETEDFSRMFYGCWQLAELDMSGIRTDSAVNLSEMFANCMALKTLDISGFEMKTVEDLSGMFSCCNSLMWITTLNWVDTYHVRDVSYMLYRCPVARDITITDPTFTFRNVDRYDNFADEKVLINGDPWIAFFEPEGESAAHSVSVGDILPFGHYEQDNVKSNGKEVIEWMVLDIQGNRALLLSCYALDSKPYNKATVSVTWESSDIRKWLNGEFLDAAFSETDQKSILTTELDNSKAQGNYKWDVIGGNNTEDKVFLLSYQDIEKYFDDETDRVCMPTNYAVAMGADIRELDDGITKSGCWWLRSPGQESKQAALVNYYGTRYTNIVSNGYLSVRPALWVALE